MAERAGAVLFKTKPLTLVGPELKPGDPAPDFECLDNTLSPVTLKDTEGRVRIFSVVPSLDTPVCDAQTRRFNEAAAGMEGVDIYTVSVDLPFAQKRYCNTYGIDRVKMLSDYRDASFGAAYGTLIKELRIECRALFVVDRDGIIRHAEYVKETSSHPDYETALKAARSLMAESTAV